MNKWRFPNNQYGAENGLDTSDMETFKKDPEGALAREICQNSIDARVNKEVPVRVEFKLFEVGRNQIPGIEALTAQIEKCYEYKKNSKKEEKSLKVIKDNIHKNVIKCLRISDFNTTGLLGVSSNEKGKPYYNLTKGSGISDKLGTSGGSKGIGKYASFVASTTNTVFYSTKTIDSEVGYIGITKLCSAPIDNENEDLVTQGIGYFSSNDKIYPIQEEFKLDENFSRKEKEFGTDLYIIGFNDNENWIEDIVAKILESFMVAIVKNRFTVMVEDVCINKDTLYKVIYESNILGSKTNTVNKNIRAQYELLTNEETLQKSFDIDGKGQITVYVKAYSSQNANEATKRCVMIRYPYMKIKHSTGHSYLPYSALCIIDNCELNEKLRIIENPQHTDWEIKRLNDFPQEKKETRRLKRMMDETITNYIHEVLFKNSSDINDVEGAGEYLPSKEEGELLGNEKQIVENINISQLKPSKSDNPKAIKIDKQGESYVPYHNAEKSKGEQYKQVVSDEASIVHRVSLSKIKFRTILANREEARYDIVFTSLYDVDYCEMSIKQCGDSLDKYPVNILCATINGTECKIQDGKIVDFPIIKGKKYKISCITDIKEVFSSEVVLNACR